MENTDKNVSFFDSMISKNVQISFTGVFDSQILSVIAKNIEFALSENPIVNKKMFKIFLELAQNISYYSAEQYPNTDGTFSGYGTLTIQEFSDHFILATGNMTTNEVIEPVIEKLNTINKLNRDDLREFKRQQRNLPPSRRGGGNIGLIQVALTADNPFNFQIIELEDNQAFYIVSVKIDKNSTV
jgi:hypothetical protein